MDLSTIEGLTDAQKEAITLQHNEGIEGLRNKNEQLLGEKKTVQQLSEEKEQALADARSAATKAEEERLKLAGDVEGLKAHYEEQLATATATANESAKKANDALLSRDKDSALNSALNLIHDDYKELAKAQLSNMLKISYNDQGQAATTFELNGEVVANNVDEFKSWAEGRDTFKKILNGVDSSGAGVNQSRGSASETNNNPEALRRANISARLKASGIATKQ